MLKKHVLEVVEYMALDFHGTLFLEGKMARNWRPLFDFLPF